MPVQFKISGFECLEKSERGDDEVCLLVASLPVELLGDFDRSSPPSYIDAWPEVEVIRQFDMRLAPNVSKDDLITFDPIVHTFPQESGLLVEVLILLIEIDGSSNTLAQAEEHLARLRSSVSRLGVGMPIGADLGTRADAIRRDITFGYGPIPRSKGWDDDDMLALDIVHFETLSPTSGSLDPQSSKLLTELTDPGRARDARLAAFEITMTQAKGSPSETGIGETRRYRNEDECSEYRMDMFFNAMA